MNFKYLIAVGGAIRLNNPTSLLGEFTEDLIDIRAW